MPEFEPEGFVSNVLWTGMSCFLCVWTCGLVYRPHGKDCVTNLRKLWENQHNWVLGSLTEPKSWHAAYFKRNSNNDVFFQLPWEGRINLIFLTCIGRKLREKQVSDESELELQCLGFSGLCLCLYTGVFQTRKDGFQCTWWWSVQAWSHQISSQWPGERWREKSIILSETAVHEHEQVTLGKDVKISLPKVACLSSAHSCSCYGGVCEGRWFLLWT